MGTNRKRRAVGDRSSTRSSASTGRGDDRHIQLVFLQPDGYWADFCRVIDRPDLAEDARFADIVARRENGEACVAALDQEFAKRTYEEWKTVLAGLDLPWAPVQSVLESCSMIRRWKRTATSARW